MYNKSESKILAGVAALDAFEKAKEQKQEAVAKKRQDIRRPWDFKVRYGYTKVYFKGNLARVEKDGKWGIVNKKGEVMLSIIYDYVWPIKGDGAVRVRLGEQVQIINIVE
jgi:hypothetical protein